ncbi:hypothetical protein PGT21_001669 [Puccinia graminis f. sp. tritici]|uniref:Translation initiation factor IF2/IF5 domain-containing protein n=2 Tax=Puccinia graminis f. sp. tritici TaxID=56615 RepID=E3KJS4_PUCGT|nr:uncharacterized protein PGTG_10708 [Puccinia graminis f. sp. tritici CRL 75-36-700-3]EFP84549.1 hypothetical protein PGTG_10708 [Puccinia graminis f. sp. tritici CRL 75-36-700-3]KAA1100925.1 hypothetical protein PGT21_001669 [Puccinia graminis f. sp. tritici]
MAEELNNPPVEQAEEPLFDATLKKKKKKKAVAFDELDSQLDNAAEQPTSITTSKTEEPVSILKTTEAEPSSKAPEPAASGDLDFSDLKRKKKKKTVTLDLDEDELNVADEKDKSASTATAAEDAAAAEEFADLKKKKKNQKKAFDLEAFERELAEVEGGINKSEAKEGDPSGADGDDPPEDGLFGQADDEAIGESEKSKAQMAAEKKAWLKEPDRDYTYDELLGRFYQALYLSHPSLSGGGAKKRYTLAPPSVHREGNKRSIWANVAEICKKMHRQPEHVIQFLFAELGTSGSVDGNGNLVIKGRFQQKQIENVLRRYIVEYVTCKTCKSPDTLLEKDNRLYFVTCESCGSKRSVSAIKTGFSAQIGKRKSQRAN